MIQVTTPSDKKHYLHPDAIAQIVEARPSSQYRISCYVKLFDGSTIESVDDVSKLIAEPDLRDAYTGAMEEVAIWKRRALEAESLNRKFVAEINGPTHMGEPARVPSNIPPGYQLVPIEPTKEMLYAAFAADKEYCARMFGSTDAVVSVGAYDHYVAMLAAAKEES